MTRKSFYLLILGIIFLILLMIFLLNQLHWKPVAIELQPKNEYLSSETQNANGHVELLEKYSTEVSEGYFNSDGTTTIYIYSSPINYYTKSGTRYPIDTRIANVTNNAFLQNDYYYMTANSDINAYFPQKFKTGKGVRISGHVEYEFGFMGNSKNCEYSSATTFLGEKRDVLYYKNILDGIDLYTYPSSTGAIFELKLTKEIRSPINAWIKLESNSLTINQSALGYLALETREDTPTTKGVIQKPIVKFHDGSYSFNGKIHYQYAQSGLYYISLDFEEQELTCGSTVYLSVEGKRENQPDNALYSKMPDLEYGHLNQISTIGTSDLFGQGQLLIRFLFANNFISNDDNLISAHYTTYRLTNNCTKFEMYEVLEDWCSLTGNWSKQYKTGECVSFCSPDEALLVFDILDITKQWCQDKTGFKEHCGLLLKSAPEDATADILLSNDCVLFNNFTTIRITNEE